MLSQVWVAELGPLLSRYRGPGHKMRFPRLCRSVFALASPLVFLSLWSDCGGTDPAIIRIEVLHGVLYFDAWEGSDPNPASQTLTVTNTGEATLEWSASDDGAWLGVTPTSGSLGEEASKTVTVTVSSASLDAGSYEGTITVADPDATNSPQTVSVDLTVTTGEPVIRVTVGSSATATVTSGETLSIPILTDMTDPAGQDVASMTAVVTWDPTKFTFGSSAAGNFGSVVINDTEVSSGTLRVSMFNATGTTDSFTLATLGLTAQVFSGSTDVAVNVTAAGNEAGQDITDTVEERALTVNQS